MGWNYTDSSGRALIVDGRAVTAVYVESGSDENPDSGDEERCWFVYPGDDDAEPVVSPGKVVGVTFYSRDLAYEYADRLATYFGGVEVVDSL